MKNWLGDYDSVAFVAPSGGVTSGVPVLLGTLLAVPTTTADAGAKFHGKIEGLFDLPKQAGVAITQGAAVYWDSTNGYVNTTSSGNTKIGVAEVAAAAGDATARVILVPLA